MSPAADLPADLPPELWRTFGMHFADALDLFRRIEPLRSLGLGPWSVFVAVAGSFRRSGASCGAGELATACGCSRRSVFRYLGELQAAALVRPVGSRNNGHYAVGPALEPILRAFALDRHPGTWRVRAPSPSATVALDPPAPDLSSLTNKNKDLLSSASSSSSSGDRAASRRIACAALVALHRHAYPDMPAPRMLDPRDVALVERCGARGDWDAATLEQMHLDAIQSACRTSSGPPRPAYIWGDLLHFLDHVRRGRAQRERDQPKPPRPRVRRAPLEPPAPPDWVAEHVGAALKLL